MADDDLTQMIEAALAASPSSTPDDHDSNPEEDERLVSAAAVRRALPPSMRITRAALRALQSGLEAYAAETWAWARLLSRVQGRSGACPRPGTIRLGARLATRPPPR